MMFEQTDPKALIKWLILAALLYLLFPYDVIPDFAGLIGRIDDVLLMGWLAWFYRGRLREFVANAASSAQGTEGGDARTEGQGASSHAHATDVFDPYAVLGVSRAATNAEIQAAYRARMHEYHPDKVSHLGQELQVLAHEKSQLIQRAYKELS